MDPDSSRRTKAAVGPTSKNGKGGKSDVNERVGVVVEPGVPVSQLKPPPMSVPPPLGQYPHSRKAPPGAPWYVEGAARPMPMRVAGKSNRFGIVLEGSRGGNEIGIGSGEGGVQAERTYSSVRDLNMSISRVYNESDWGAGQWDDFPSSFSINDELGAARDRKDGKQEPVHDNKPLIEAIKIKEAGENGTEDLQNESAMTLLANANMNSKSNEDEFDVRALEGWLRKRRTAKHYELAAAHYRRVMLHTMKKNVFISWKNYVWGFIGLRNELLKYFIMNFMQRRLHAWRTIARREKILLKCVKRLWRRKLRLAWNMWKVSTLYKKNKNKLLIYAMAKFKSCRIKRKKMYSKWYNFRVKYYKYNKSKLALTKSHFMARMIQKTFRWHYLRLRFWATKTIKNFMMRCFGLTVLHNRKLYEEERSRCEHANVGFIVKKMYGDFEAILQTGPGKVLLKSYEEKVDVAIKSNIATIFPPPRVLPDISKCWTTSSKRQLCLKHECIRRATVLARSKFRLIAPPLYDCKYCPFVSLMKKLYKFHHENCVERYNFIAVPPPSPFVRKAIPISRQKFVERESVYECFVWSRLLVDEALRSSTKLISSYIKPTIIKIQKKENQRIRRRRRILDDEERRGEICRRKFKDTSKAKSDLLTSRNGDSLIESLVSTILESSNLQSIEHKPTKSIVEDPFNSPRTSRNREALIETLVFTILEYSKMRSTESEKAMSNLATSSPIKIGVDHFNSPRTSRNREALIESLEFAKSQILESSNFQSTRPEQVASTPIASSLSRVGIDHFNSPRTAGNRLALNNSMSTAKLLSPLLSAHGSADPGPRFEWKFNERNVAPPDIAKPEYTSIHINSRMEVVRVLNYNGEGEAVGLTNISPPRPSRKRDV